MWKRSHEMKNIRSTGNRQTSKAFIQLVFIALCFTVGLAPGRILSFMLARSGKLTDCRTILNFHIGHTITLITLRLSETINPLIYSIGSQDLRDEVKKLLGINQEVPKLSPDRELPNRVIYNSATLLKN